MQMNDFLALVRNIKIKCTFDSQDVLDGFARKKAIKQLNYLLKASYDYEQSFVYKKSVDARDRNNILIVYTIAVPVSEKTASLQAKGVDFVEIHNFDKILKDFLG